MKTLCLILASLISMTIGMSNATADSSQASSESSNERPNIVLIMADDVGIEGLGCYGGTSYKTPNLDRMAAQGIRFTHAYSQPLCTPTRVELMTGKYNHRNWRYFGILDPNEVTFGHRLQEAGYATAIFGKWQLQSYDPPDWPGAAKRRSSGMHPKDAGFDEYALYHALHTEDKGSRYANPSMLEGHAGEDGTLKTYPGEYGEDVWVDKTLKFLAEPRDKPAFVYYPMALPHWPFVPTPNSKEWDPEVDPQPESLHFAGDMIEYMDTAVGRLLDGIRQQGTASKTLVLFYSDNGTHLKVSSQFEDGRTIPGGKATPLQTGVHVPLIAYQPGVIHPAVSDRLVDASDFVRTLGDLSKSEAAKFQTDDGHSFADVLGYSSSSLNEPRESVFVWYDPRPGWDKDRFHRHVFALDRQHKLFRDGRLFRLPRPLEETLVDAANMTAKDQAASHRLSVVIAEAMNGVTEPPLVDAYGEPASR